MTNDEQSNDEVRRIKKIISQSDIYPFHFVIRLFGVRDSSFFYFLWTGNFTYCQRMFKMF